MLSGDRCITFPYSSGFRLDLCPKGWEVLLRTHTMGGQRLVKLAYIDPKNMVLGVVVDQASIFKDELYVQRYVLSRLEHLKGLRLAIFKGHYQLVNVLMICEDLLDDAGKYILCKEATARCGNRDVTQLVAAAYGDLVKGICVKQVADFWTSTSDLRFVWNISYKR